MYGCRFILYYMLYSIQFGTSFSWVSKEKHELTGGLKVLEIAGFYSIENVYTLKGRSNCANMY